VFVPIRDENPLQRIPLAYVNLGLIAANVLVFLLQDYGGLARHAASFALIPADLFGAGLFGGTEFRPGEAVAVPEAYTLLTYMFMHGDILHLFSNMIFLWVFGDNIEDALGHARYLAFYILCGVIAAMVHALMMPSSRIPLIGASGAVAGVVSAYLILHPQVRVWVLVLRFIPLRLTAAWVLGAWIAMQFFMLIVPDVTPIAWWAHVGGIVAGAALVVVMRRPGVPLFGGVPT